jgi:putative tryptophan/tyrosine transport system substrate-binding protein
MMKRRAFITLLGGAAAAWPLAASGQQPERMRRIGVLMYGDENDYDYKARLLGFMQSLAQSGWADGRNLLVDVRWTAANLDLVRRYAKELVALKPDVLVATSTPVTAAFQYETPAIPVVFVGISDPVGAGFVANLAHPSGNLTGFINIEAGMGGKWLELLNEIAPGIQRAAIMFSPDTTTAAYYMPSFEAAARSLGVTSVAAPVRSDADIETAITMLGREPGGSLILPPDGFTTAHRGLIISLAEQAHVPFVAAVASLAREGGLLSYGPDSADIYRRAASYVDRILRGTKPAELPVQVPVKFEMIVNAKTAKALGLRLPQSILLRADEVIE